MRGIQPFVVALERVDGLPGRFTRHSVSGQASQLVVNQRQQLLGGLGVALLNGIEQAGDLTHERSIDDTLGKSMALLSP